MCVPYDKIVMSTCRLFRNLTKEVTLYAQKFVDRGKVQLLLSSLVKYAH